MYCFAYSATSFPKLLLLKMFVKLLLEFCSTTELSSAILVSVKLLDVTCSFSFEIVINLLFTYPEALLLVILYHSPSSASIFTLSL